MDLPAPSSPTCEEASLSDGATPPRILLMGQTGSGKSSIHKVVFQKMCAAETCHLPTTYRIVKDYVSDFIQFEIWDIPGQFKLSDIDAVATFSCTGTLIFIIDSQGELEEAVKMLVKVIRKASSVNSGLNFEVFLHKIDGIAEYERVDLLDGVSKLQKEMFQESEMGDINPRYHMTSIYDISVYEGLSRVIQRLIPQQPALERLLNGFALTSGAAKLYLFDVFTKLAIAADSAPDDSVQFHICSDVIDIAVDVGTICCADVIADGCPYDEESQCTIRLDDNSVVCLRAVNRYLALVCQLPVQHYRYEGIVDYNFKCLCAAVSKVMQAYKWTMSQDCQSPTDATDDCAAAAAAAAAAAGPLDS